MWLEARISAGQAHDVCGSTLHLKTCICTCERLKWIASQHMCVLLFIFYEQMWVMWVKTRCIFNWENLWKAISNALLERWFRTRHTMIWKLRVRPKCWPDNLNLNIGCQKWISRTLILQIFFFQNFSLNNTMSISFFFLNVHSKNNINHQD